MPAAAAGELVVLGLTVALAFAIDRLLRRYVTIVPGAATRVFGGVMTAHAVVNLIGRNWLLADADVVSVAVANLSGLVFLIVYGNALLRHARGALHAAFALLFASYATFAGLTAAQWVPFEPALFAYATVFAVFGAIVLWRASARSAVWAGRNLRALRSR